MKLTTQEEYGLRCLLRLGRQESGASLTIPEISQAEDISPHNVAKFLRILRQGGLVDSVRGQRGGYILSRPPEEIAIAAVVAILGNRLYEPDFCEQFSGSAEICQHSSVDCAIRSLWMRVQRAVDQVLSQTTLQDLIDWGRQMQHASSPLAADLLEVVQPS